jgi:hypothetical protein
MNEFKIIDLYKLTDSDFTKYGLNKKDLYTYNKFDEDEQNSETLYKDYNNKISETNIIYTKKISGGAKITTYYNKPNPDEINKMIRFINKYSNMGVHIPFIFQGITYFIELTAKKQNKFVISISNDNKHKEELIHISCFPSSFIHITFIDEDTKKHYKIYYLSNPEFTNGLEYILSIIMNIHGIWDIPKFPNICSDIPSNNWKEEIITDINKKNAFHRKLYILLQSITYVIKEIDINKYIH